MPTVIYTRTKSHSDDDGDLFPEMASGTDTHSFSVPDGDQYLGYSINVRSQTFLSSYTVISQPAIGATGNQRIKIEWFYPIFGKIAYEIKVRSKKIDDEELAMYINFGENGWERQVMDAVNQGVRIKIIFNGDIANQLANLLRMQQSFSTSTSNIIEPATAAVLITLIIFGTLGGLLLYAMNQNYKADAKAGVETPFGDADLEISLDPQS